MSRRKCTALRGAIRTDVDSAAVAEYVITRLRHNGLEVGEAAENAIDDAVYEYLRDRCYRGIR